MLRIWAPTRCVDPGPPPSGPWNSSMLHFSVDRGAGWRPRRFEIGFDILGKVSAVEGRPSAGSFILFCFFCFQQQNKLFPKCTSVQ